MRAIWSVFAASFVLLVLGCGKNSTGPTGMRGEVVSTADNIHLSGQVVVTQEGGAATESVTYRAYLINTETGSSQLLLVADKTDGVAAAWIPSGIELSMQCGRVLDTSGNLKTRIGVELSGAHLCSQ
jgi:hypothetical protein